MSLPREITQEDVAALLSAAGHEVSAEQITAIFDFLQQVGSVENAQQALAAIEELKRAA